MKNNANKETTESFSMYQLYCDGRKDQSYLTNELIVNTTHKKIVIEEHMSVLFQLRSIYLCH